MNLGTPLFNEGYRRFAVAIGYRGPDFNQNVPRAWSIGTPCLWMSRWRSSHHPSPAIRITPGSQDSGVVVFGPTGVRAPRPTYLAGDSGALAQGGPARGLGVSVLSECSKTGWGDWSRSVARLNRTTFSTA